MHVFIWRPEDKLRCSAHFISLVLIMTYLLERWGNMRRSEDNCGRLFFSLITWVLGTELRPPGLVAITYAHRTISMSPSCFGYRFFSHWSRVCQMGCPGWLASPKDLYVSAFQVLWSHVHARAHSFYTWLLGTGLRALCLYGKYLNGRVVFPDPDILLMHQPS